VQVYLTISCRALCVLNLKRYWGSMQVVLNISITNIILRQLDLDILGTSNQFQIDKDPLYIYNNMNEDTGVL
jgi:hypothetical protein